jgi:hypothetical protein
VGEKSEKREEELMTLMMDNRLSRFIEFVAIFTIKRNGQGKNLKWGVAWGWVPIFAKFEVIFMKGEKS